MKPFKYCPHCRVELEKRALEGRERYFCPRCEWINYLNPLPVISCLVADRDKKILLIERAKEPMIGSWALPGGFVEIDETPEDAGERELFEETGLAGRPDRLISVLSHKSPLYGPLMMVGFEYHVTGGSLSAGDDARDAAFFSFKGLPEIPFGSHRILIEKFRDLL